MLGSIRAVGLVVALVSSASAQENPNERANALFAEATKQFNAAANMTFDAAIMIYQDGLATLDQIVEKYPSSGLAVQIASGQMIANSDYKAKIPMGSGSMKPAFAAGDRLAVFSLRAAPMPGDIVIYLPPKDSTRYFVHRLIGVAGDRIQMLDGHLRINDRPVDRVRVDDYEETESGRTTRIKRWQETLPNGARFQTLDLIENGFLDNTKVYVVPDGHYFMMGDNRDNSSDSRVESQVGYVPAANILGRVVRSK